MGVTLFSTVLEAIGLLLLAIGGFTVAPVFGFIVLGVGCVLFGLALSSPPSAPPEPQTPQDH